MFIRWVYKDEWKSIKIEVDWCSMLFTSFQFCMNRTTAEKLMSNELLNELSISDEDRAIRIHTKLKSLAHYSNRHYHLAMLGSQLVREENVQLRRNFNMDRTLSVTVFRLRSWKAMGRDNSFLLIINWMNFF